MTSLDDALSDLRRYQHDEWAAAAARGFATPETDAQLLDVWEIRELLSTAASRLAALRAARPHDRELAAVDDQLPSVHHSVYLVECARHRELGSVAPGERKSGSVAITRPRVLRTDGS